MEKCSGHDNLVKDAAMGTAMFAEHGRQLSGIFDALSEIKTMVDQNQVRAATRDIAIVDLKECITEVDGKIENGLRAAVTKMALQMEGVVGIIDKRREDRSEHNGDSERGVKGFLRPGWKKFQNEASFIVVTASIITGIWFVIWGGSKLAIFHEGPAGLLKLFGIG